MPLDCILMSVSGSKKLPPPSKRLKQADIAAKLDLSISAVSLALSDPQTSRVSPEKRAEIHRLAESMGYTKPRRVKCRNLAILYNDFFPKEFHFKKASFYRELLPNVRDVAACYKREVVVRGGSPSIEAEALEHVACGAIVLSDFPREQLLALQERGIPIVFVNRSAGDLCDSVIPDWSMGTFEAVRHLIARGHRRIGFLGQRHRRGTVGYGDNLSLYLRLNGYENAMRMEQLAIQPDWIALPPHGMPESDYPEFGIEAIVAGWARDGNAPSAVVCSSDHEAGALIREARKIGLSVPGELSVIGSDNSFQPEPGEAGITSIAPDHRTVAQIAVNILEAQITLGIRRPGARHSVSTSIVERDSVATIHE